MKVLLIILDGWGSSFQERGNAIAKAQLPTFDYIQAHYPSCLLKSSGISVGLPWVEPGNSEVGHLTLGSGRVTLQAMPRIIEALRNGSFFTNAAFTKAVENVKTHGSKLHLMGLLGSGSVHSYIDHLYGLLELGSRAGISSQIRLHVFTDGEDSPPQEAAKMLAHVKLRLDETKQAQISSIMGRHFAMDRDYNWDRTERAFNLLVHGQGEKATDEVQAVQAYYAKGISDSEIPPTVFLGEDGNPRGVISPQDSVIFFNYREDSARQLTKSFVLPSKVGFKPDVPPGILFVSMTQYDKEIPCEVAFGPVLLNNTLAQVLAKNNKTQLHVAETHKYAHATYFFNGLKEELYAGEDWQLVSSLENSDFSTSPELKAPEVAEIVKQSIEKNAHDFIVVNFANADVLAHTGNFSATVKGCEVLDRIVKELMDSVAAVSDKETWAILITADHGHAETMMDLVSGTVLTEHTSNDVPLYLISPAFKHDFTALEIYAKKQSAIGMLADVAPTVLELFTIPQPPEMTGKSLISQILPS